MNNLIYEDSSPWEGWLKIILGGVIGLLFVLAVWTIQTNIEEGLVLFGSMLFIAAILHAIMPRKLQIYPDRLRIVFGKPFAWTIRFSNIKEVKRAPNYSAFAFWGLKFATSSKNIIEIKLKKGLSLIISPANGELFLEQLNRAMKEAIST